MARLGLKSAMLALVLGLACTVPTITVAQQNDNGPRGLNDNANTRDTLPRGMNDNANTRDTLPRGLNDNANARGAQDGAKKDDQK